MKTLWPHLQLTPEMFYAYYIDKGSYWEGKELQHCTFERMMRKISIIHQHEYARDMYMFSCAMLANGMTGPLKAELHATYQQHLMNQGWRFKRYDSRTTLVIPPTEQLDAESLRQLELDGAPPVE